MAKLANYILLLSGISLLFYFMGILVDTPSSFLLSLILNPANLQATPWWVVTLSITGVIVTGGVIFVGWVATKSELWVFAPLLPLFFALGWDFIAIFAELNSINPILAVLFIGPILFVYTLMVIEWWRNMG